VNLKRILKMKKKRFYALLIVLWTGSALAQQSELPAPDVLKAEAATFLKEFEKAVIYLADKRNPKPKRIAYAEALSARFADKAVIQVMNGQVKTNLTPLKYFLRVIDLNYDQVHFEFVTQKNTALQTTADGWFQTQYTLEQHFTGMRNGKVASADFTIKTIDLYFLYTAATKSWTKKYGHVLAHSNQKLR
jgi:hypothetical protein